MKLLLFLIIVLVIYLIAINIKVVHTSTLPIIDKKELEDRQKIRQMLTTRHIKSCENDEKINEIIKKPKIENFSLVNKQLSASPKYYIPGHKTNLPVGSKLLSMIKSEFLSESYTFNFANLPVTTRYPNSDSMRKDNIYKKYITKSIEEWNDVFNGDHKTKNYLLVKNISLLFIKETENEFVIVSNIKLLYLNKSLHLQTTFYGKINRNDDFINGGFDTWILQLVDIKPIKKAEYNSSINQSNSWSGPFMSMTEQMAYVDKINKMHRDEDQ